MIDARALVSPQAELAADVTVGPFSVIGPQVRIGARTRIAAHVVINGPTTIGADNVFFQFASIGDAPQDKKYQGEPTRLEIGDRNVFRESCTVNRGTAHDEARHARRRRQPADGVHARRARLPGRQPHRDGQLRGALSGHVELGDWVIMGGYSGVHQFCKVGAHAFIANNAAVTRDVPPYVMAVGQPATPHSVNSEGLKRRDFSAAQIRNIREAFRILYRRDLPLEAAVKELTALARNAAGDPPVRRFHRRIEAQPDPLDSGDRRIPGGDRGRRDLRRPARRRADRRAARALPGHQVRGVCGPLMHAAGCEPLADAQRAGGDGPGRGARVTCRGCCDCGARLRREFSAWRPDVFIGIDAPEFNLGLAAQLARGGPQDRAVRESAGVGLARSGA